MSWQTMFEEQAGEDREDACGDGRTNPAHDDEAAEMHRLRGLVMAQGTETESVLRMIVEQLDRGANVAKRTAGLLIRDVRRLLSDDDREYWEYELCGIEEAIERRNHAVHSDVSIGFSWMSYATGDGGEWVPVVSTLGNEVYSEADLRDDFKLQQVATRLAVEILHYLKRAEE